MLDPLCYLGTSIVECPEACSSLLCLLVVQRYALPFQSEYHLFVIVLFSIVHDIEEAQLVDALRCRDNPQPVPQLLLLKELLSPAQQSVHARSHIIKPTYKYFKYLPENS